MNLNAPELNRVRIGYIPLTDCLPLIIAKGLGLFAEQDLDVQLTQEASWANIRDKLVVGHLDAAHMLAPMVLASSLGLGGLKKNLLTAFTLNLNGNGITLSNRLSQVLGLQGQHLSPPNALADVIRERREAGKEALVFAVVFPFSSHNYLLRDWLASAGIDPDRDVKLVVLPPPQMVDNLRLEHIDGFCVGEPWNSVAVQQGLGQCAMLSCSYWPNRMEKVFAVTQSWATAYPATHAALLRALHKACVWLDNHRAEAAELVHGNTLLPLEHSIIAPGLTGKFQFSQLGQLQNHPDLLVFHRQQANLPSFAQGLEILNNMERWNQLETEQKLDEISRHRLVNACFRPDIYKEVFQT